MNKKDVLVILEEAILDNQELNYIIYEGVLERLISEKVIIIKEVKND